MMRFTSPLSRCEADMRSARAYAMASAIFCLYLSTPSCRKVGEGWEHSASIVSPSRGGPSSVRARKNRGACSGSVEGMPHSPAGSKRVARHRAQLFGEGGDSHGIPWLLIHSGSSVQAPRPLVVWRMRT